MHVYISQLKYGMRFGIFGVSLLKYCLHFCISQLKRGLRFPSFPTETSLALPYLLRKFAILHIGNTQTQSMFRLGNAKMHVLFQLDNRAIV